MNTKNNLHYALKNAFENHEVPLREAQWQRLEGALIHTKPRKRYISLLFTLSLVVISSLSTYLLTIEFTRSQRPAQQDSETASNTEYPSRITTPPNAVTLKKKRSGLSKNSISLVTSTFNKYHSSSNNHNSRIADKNRPAVATVQPEIFAEIGNEEVQEATDEDSETGKSEIIPSITAETSESAPEPSGKPEKGSVEKKEDYTGSPKSPRWAFSASAGISKLNLRVQQIDNANKLHKDTRALYEAAHQNNKTFFFNLGLDYNLVPGLNLGLNSGLQYLKMSNPVEVRYRVTDVPFYDADRSIAGYYNPDSADVIELAASTTNTTTFINIPLRLNYTIPLNKKSEFLFTFGANFMTLIAAKGKDISLNEMKVKPLDKDVYHRFSAGFLGGAQYSHRIKDPWWAGVETQWMSNNLAYKAGPGTLNAQLKGYRFNVILKYKL